MRKKQIWQNISRVALGLGAVSLLGVYGYIQYQNVSDLQRQIAQLPDGKDKTALVKDRIALENTIAGSVIQAVGGLLLFVRGCLKSRSWSNFTPIASPSCESSPDR